MHKLVIETYPIGLLGSNVYLIYAHDGSEAAVVDPGLRDVSPIRQALSTHSLHLRYIVNTHGHFDHVAGNGALKRPDVNLAIHPADSGLLDLGGGGTAFGYSIAPSPEPDLYLHNGEEIQIDELVFQVIHTPGHTPGSLCLYHPEEPSLLTGDTLFAGGVGRTDLPGGDPKKLQQSLRQLMTLPGSTKLYPGHGPCAVLADEMENNPWLRQWEPPVTDSA